MRAGGRRWGIQKRLLNKKAGSSGTHVKAFNQNCMYRIKRSIIMQFFLAIILWYLFIGQTYLSWNWHSGSAVI